MTLRKKVLFITGASRGIGMAIALRAARDGACIAIVAKTTEPHPKLTGTIHTAAEAVKAAGGQAFAIACDIRDEAQIREAVAKTVEAFGGIDVCINNASAIDLEPTSNMSMKKFDLLQQINVRGTFLVTRECLPYLLNASNPHVLNLSPPLPIPAHLLGPSPAYAQSKAAMSFYATAMAAEYSNRGVAFNTLWPQTMIATAAVELVGTAEHIRRSRTPEIMADAAYWIVTQSSRVCSGHHYIDEDVLVAAGLTDLSGYRNTPGEETLMTDLFVEPRSVRVGVKY